MNEKKKKVITKPTVPIRSQAKFGKGRDFGGWPGFVAENPTAPGRQEWADWEDELLAERSPNNARAILQYAVLDRRAALGR